MEDLFEIEIINILKKMYSYEEEKDILELFFLRSMIYNLDIKLKNEDILNFLYREINLPNTNPLNYNNHCIYKKYYSSYDSVESIIDNWKFRILEKTSLTFNNKRETVKDILIKKYNIYFDNATKELKKFSKNTLYYGQAFRHIMLLYLYKDYNIEYINESVEIKDLVYTFDVDFLSKINIDLEYKRYYDTLYLKEEEKEKFLENFIYFNYNKSTSNKLFNDITITDRQYKVKSGIIDLLGKDDNGNIVIIELKAVKRPIDIFYQIKAYRNNIKNKFKTDKIRFIVISPKLKEDFFEEIKDENIELYYYTKKIDKFNFTKIL